MQHVNWSGVKQSGTPIERAGLNLLGIKSPTYVKWIVNHTALKEACGSLSDGCGELIRDFQIQQDVNIGSKNNHVLFSTAIRHL